MFIRLSLGELYEVYNVHHNNLEFFSKRQQKDFLIILKQFDEEDISIPLWYIWNIQPSYIKGTFIYNLSSTNELQRVEIHISKNGLVKPSYDKCFDNGEYKSETANTIKRAIAENQINEKKYQDQQNQKLFTPVAKVIVSKIIEKESEQKIKKYINTQSIPSLSDYICQYTEFYLDPNEDDSLINREGFEDLTYSRLEKTILSLLKEIIRNSVLKKD